ncbi:hypothetical protein [Clostridium tyrobutyricum]|uniref:hypothetical protein n=1 Tax=Clostridium tyrobutyricum TaxID=1519 RepID=UPI001C38C1D9|nr:hypothetical protein [Clostridium tyrobutyricum]MBV4428858.1 hypothetical protein [Clostridium tyrobutyricum]MBV4444847.1 hypothetical protein [Clostridium tyrobutyricum]
MKKLKLFSKRVTIIIPLLFMIFGAIVYTTEYTGEGNNPGVIKKFLDASIPISVLMAIIISVIMIWIISTICLVFCVNVEKLVKEKDDYKNSYEKLLTDVEKNNNNKLDKNVFKRIKEILPLEKMMDFTRDLDLGNKFSFDYVEMIDDFFRTENNPEYRFIDLKLEQLRNDLIYTLKDLNSVLAEYSDRIGDTNLWRIRRTLKSDNPELYSKTIRLANSYATKAWELYDDLISSARQLLGE